MNLNDEKQQENEQMDNNSELRQFGTETAQNEKESESESDQAQNTSERDRTAFISGNEFDLNRNVVVDEQRHVIHKSRKITIDYNPRKNKLIIKQGFEYLNGKTRLEAFFKSLGYKNQKEFMKHEMQKTVVIFGMASRVGWYNDLTENSFSFR